MKKLLALILSLISLATLFSCGDNNDGIAEGYYTLTGTVKSIGDNYITVIGTEGVEEGVTYRVNLHSDTIYKKNGEQVTSSSLYEGASVIVSYNGMATRSVPPQINATKIIIESGKSGKTVDGTSDSFTMTATVTKVENGSITVEAVESEYAYGTYVVHVSDATVLLSLSGEYIELSDIKVGDSVEIVYGGQVMLSMPPQIAAEKIQKKS
ncbi:MAG: hypothetical protein IJW03_04635 [Clostridia bacterium]|nr:hypothetical protein [Clostridia bacterium]